MTAAPLDGLVTIVVSTRPSLRSNSVALTSDNLRQRRCAGEAQNFAAWRKHHNAASVEIAHCSSSRSSSRRFNCHPAYTVCFSSKHKPETLIGSHSGAPVGRQDLSNRLLHAESSPRLTAPVVHALSYLSAGCYALDAEMWADVPALARSDPQDHKRRGAAWAS
jgi:hypothetical protein